MEEKVLPFWGSDQWLISKIKEQGKYSQIQSLLQKRIKSVLFLAFSGIKEHMACSLILKKLEKSTLRILKN